MSCSLDQKRLIDSYQLGYICDRIFGKSRTCSRQVHIPGSIGQLEI